MRAWINSLGGEKSPVRTWDCGRGAAWVYMQSCGPFMEVVGVVRAETWEEAYDAAIDEIAHDGDTSEALSVDGGASAAGDHLAEGFVYRGGMPCNTELRSVIAWTDPGNERLVRADRALCDSLRLSVRF